MHSSQASSDTHDSFSGIALKDSNRLLSCAATADPGPGRRSGLPHGRICSLAGRLAGRQRSRCQRADRAQHVTGARTHHASQPSAPGRRAGLVWARGHSQAASWVRLTAAGEQLPSGGHAAAVCAADRPRAAADPSLNTLTGTPAPSSIKQLLLMLKEL